MDGSAQPNTVKGAAGMALQVVAGLHLGASRPLTLSDLVMIGSGDDCDVILSDAGVARHHCLLMRQGRRWSLRAIDAALGVAGQSHAPGETLQLGPGVPVALGGASFVVDIAAAVPEAAPEHAAAPPPRQLWRRHRWSLAVTLGLAAALGLATSALGLHTANGGAVPGADELASRAVSRLGLDEVTPVRNDAGQIELRGVVPDAQSAARLRDDLQKRHIAATVVVRSGAEVAHDVEEVLRLSGIVAEAQYSGDGSVTVSGHLGDQRTLGEAVESRAMHEIQGLRRVVAYNQDHPGQALSSSVPDAKRIVSAVAAQDPYIITADGSHYYVGAQLPQGGRLSGVEPGTVLVEREGRIDRLKLPGARLGG